MKSIKHVWWTLIGHRKDIDLPQTRMDLIQSPDQSYSQGVVSFELWKSLFVIIMFLDTSQNRGHFDGDTSTQKHMSGTKENKNILSEKDSIFHPSPRPIQNTAKCLWTWYHWL